MSAPESSSFNLEHLKKHAKQLLRECRAGDAASIARMQVALPRMRSLDPSRVPAEIHLADVQHALARERGCSSWADLSRSGDRLARLLTAVRGGHIHTLRRELVDFVGLADVSVHAACALGNRVALARHLAADGSLATQPADGWPPLMYVCASPLTRFSPRHAASLADCLDLLLDGGADAREESIQPEAFGGQRTPPIVRAMMAANLTVVERLRSRGIAHPHDALQRWVSASASPEAARLHVMFGEYFRRPDVQARTQALRMEIAAERRADPGGTLDLHDPQRAMRLPNLIGAQEPLWRAVVDQGMDLSAIGVGGQSPLHGLVKYAPPAFMEFYLSRGGNIAVRDAQGRSLVTTAVRAGNLRVADLLKARGIEDDTTPVDRLVGACLAGDAALARAIVAEYPSLPASLTREDADTFVRAAARGDLAQVTLMVDIGIDPDIRDEAGATALHQAAWRGQVDVVRLLLSRGASASLRDDIYSELPREWATHGAVHTKAEAGCLEAAAMLEKSIGE